MQQHTGNPTRIEDANISFDHRLVLHALLPAVSIGQGFQLLEEGVDDEGNDDIVYYNDTEKMETKKEDAHPLSTSDILKANLTFGPIIYHQ